MMRVRKRDAHRQGDAAETREATAEMMDVFEAA